MRAVSAPTVVIIAAGEGTRMRSVAAEGPAPALRAPADPLAGGRRAGGRGRARSSWSTTRSGGSRTSCPRASRSRSRSSRTGPGDAVAAAGSHIDASATVVVINGDVPLITAEAIAGARRRRTRSSGAAGTMATMELDDPARLRARRARPRGQRRAGRRDQGGEGDATPEQLAIREVNTGVYAFDGASLLAALGRARHRQRAGRAVPARRAAEAARGRASRSART